MIELAPRSKFLMSYEEAILYCQFLEHNGCRDWRLPTYDEWDTQSMDQLAWYRILADNSPVNVHWYVMPVRFVIPVRYSDLS